MSRYLSDDLVFFINYVRETNLFHVKVATELGQATAAGYKVNFTLNPIDYYDQGTIDEFCAKLDRRYRFPNVDLKILNTAVINFILEGGNLFSSEGMKEYKKIVRPVLGYTFETFETISKNYKNSLQARLICNQLVLTAFNTAAMATLKKINADLAENTLAQFLEPELIAELKKLKFVSTVDSVSLQGPLTVFELTPPPRPPKPSIFSVIPPPDDFSDSNEFLASKASFSPGS